MAVCSYNHNVFGEKQEDFWGLDGHESSQSVSSRFNERPYLKKRRCSVIGKDLNINKTPQQAAMYSPNDASRSYMHTGFTHLSSAFPIILS